MKNDDEMIIKCDFCDVEFMRHELVGGPYDNLICLSCAEDFIEENEEEIRVRNIEDLTNWQ